jgi:Flp pilus assembly protein TadG
MWKTSREGSRGQALTEVAMVAPLFFLMVFGTIDIGRAIWANDVVASAAREGARYASVHAGSVNPDFGGLTTLATKDEIKAHAVNFVIAGGASPSATVCFSSAATLANQGAGCSGDVDESPDVGYERGNLVTVKVTSHVPTILGSFFGATTWTVTGESTVLINN